MEPSAEPILHAATSSSDASALDSILAEVRAEVNRQDVIHPPGYPATRDGIRFGIATIDDELRETWEAWRSERRIDGWAETRIELIQAIGVALRLLRSLAKTADGQA